MTYLCLKELVLGGRRRIARFDYLGIRGRRAFVDFESESLGSIN